MKPGGVDYPAFWSSTTHANQVSGGNASYVNFGRALGYMNNQWVDVHGAGAQRSDPKTGSAADWPTGHGPQGDAIRGSNYVRCVTGGIDSDVQVGGATDNIPITQEQLPVGQTLQGQAPNGGQPPQEALDACVSLSQGAACTVNTPNGMLAGSCITVSPVNWPVCRWVGHHRNKVGKRRGVVTVPLRSVISCC